MHSLFDPLMAGMSCSLHPFLSSSLEHQGRHCAREQWIPGSFSAGGISSHHWCGSSSSIPLRAPLPLPETSPVVVVIVMPITSHLTESRAWSIVRREPFSALCWPSSSDFSLLCGPPLSPHTHSLFNHPHCLVCTPSSTLRFAWLPAHQSQSLLSGLVPLIL